MTPYMSPASPTRLLTAAYDGFAFRFPYDPPLARAMRMQLPGVRWDKDRHEWGLPAKLGTVDAARRFAQANGFEIDTAAWTLMRRLADSGRERADQSRATTAPLPVAVDGFGLPLLPFQQAAVRYGIENERVLLADEVGLGKTIEALAILWARKAFPAVIVCPAHLKLNWKRETERCLPGIPVLVGRGLRGDDPPHDFAGVFVVNYDLLGPRRAGITEFVERAGVRAVVFDESQYLKEPDAGRSRAAEALARRVPVRLLLSGTPVKNRPRELIHQLAVLGRLDELGGFWHFARTYCDAHKETIWRKVNGVAAPKDVWVMDGATHLDRLQEVLRAIVMVRRTKAEVLPELPPKRRSEVPVEVSNLPDYHGAVREVVRTVREGGKEVAMIAKISGFEKLRHLVGLGKVEPACQWVRTFLETDQKLVAYAHHVDVQHAIYDAFPGAARLFAGDPKPTQEAEKARFQADPRCRLIVCSLMGAGTGHTLTAASHMLIVESGLSPADNEQAEGRAHARVNDVHGLNAYYLVAPGTIDDHIFNLVERKRAVVDAATGGAPGVFADRVRLQAIEAVLAEAGP